MNDRSILGDFPPKILALITIVVIGVLLFVFVGHPSTPGCGLPHHIQCG